MPFALSDDSESRDKLIGNWLDDPKFYLPGFMLKVSSVMGDRVSVAIARAIFPTETVNDVKLRKILAALHAAFEFPQSVESLSDRVPAVTECLLLALKDKCESIDQHTEIDQALSVLRAINERGETGTGKLGETGTA